MVDQLERKDICPLLDRPCLRLDCKFYLHLEGTDPQDADKRLDGWDCAVIWLLQATLGNTKALGSGLAGVQAATESFRNTAWNESQQNLTDIIGIARNQDMVVRRVAEVMSSHLPSDDIKLIESEKL